MYGVSGWFDLREMFVTRRVRQKKIDTARRDVSRAGNEIFSTSCGLGYVKKRKYEHAREMNVRFMQQRYSYNHPKRRKEDVSF